MMVGNNLKDTQLQQIVDKTILFHDKVYSNFREPSNDELILLPGSDLHLVKEIRLILDKLMLRSLHLIRK